MLEQKRLGVREKQTVENDDRIESFLLQRQKYRFGRQAHYPRWYLRVFLQGLRVGPHCSGNPMESFQNASKKQ